MNCDLKRRAIYGLSFAAASFRTLNKLRLTMPRGLDELLADQDKTSIFRNLARVWQDLAGDGVRPHRATRLRDVEVDTCHGGFLLYKPLWEVICLLSQYDLVVVDEISQLNAEQYEFIVALWEAAGRVPALMLLGDFWQLPTILAHGDKPMYESVKWNGDYIKQIDFSVAHLWRILRYRVPDSKEFGDIVRNHKAWDGHQPTAWDILQLMRKTELKTTIVSCTRFGAATVNELAARFRCWSLGVIPAEWEANPENNDEYGRPRRDRHPEPLQMAVYVGMKVFLTKNLMKIHDFVNGMSASVKSFGEASGCLIVGQRRRSGSAFTVILSTTTRPRA